MIICMKLLHLNRNKETFVDVLHDGVYIYRYTSSIFQYTFIGWIWGCPAAHLTKFVPEIPPPPPPGCSHMAYTVFLMTWLSYNMFSIIRSGKNSTWLDTNWYLNETNLSMTCDLVIFVTCNAFPLFVVLVIHVSLTVLPKTLLTAEKQIRRVFDDNGRIIKFTNHMLWVLIRNHLTEESLMKQF